jgi:uncharacterized protein YciI
MVMDLQTFQLVLLRTPEDATQYDDETIARIQREHLAFYAAQRGAGTVVTNGPVLDQPDKSLRGLAFYNVGSLDEARALAITDPAVKAHRLAVEVMTWWCAPDTMIAAGTAITVG